MINIVKPLSKSNNVLKSMMLKQFNHYTCMIDCSSTKRRRWSMDTWHSGGVQFHRAQQQILQDMYHEDKPHNDYNSQVYIITRTVRYVKTDRNTSRTVPVQ